VQPIGDFDKLASTLCGILNMWSTHKLSFPSVKDRADKFGAEVAGVPGSPPMGPRDVAGKTSVWDSAVCGEWLWLAQPPMSAECWGFGKW
jgi:hypothetical protein